MIGRLTTQGGESYELPELLSWEFYYTGGVPCDSFELCCAYSAGMLPVLHEACRFTAMEKGAVQFRGVVDEFEISSTEKGLLLNICGRGMAALLLDNETETASYQRVTLNELVRRYVEPHGIAVEKADELAADGIYKVSGGNSAWKAVAEFTRQFGGFLPHFTKTGMLRLSGNETGKTLELRPGAALLGAVYRDRRYGVISQIDVIGRSGGIRESVKNEEFIARGGHCRRVIYTAAADSDTLRAAGKYQIKQSAQESRLLTLEVAGNAGAEVGDRVRLSLAQLGIGGVFRVREVLRRMDESGEMTRLRLEEE